ncbi:MAG: hypothetical protein V3575_06745 [Candidatus Absconditabacteria bacterium]
MEQSKKTNEQDLLKKVTIHSDKLAEKIIKPTFVDKFNSLPGVKELMKNQLFLSINTFVEKNFETLVMIGGYGSIIIGILGVLSSFGMIPIIFNQFFGGTYKLYILFLILGLLVISFLTLLLGVGLLNKKKWFPAGAVMMYFVSVLYYFLEIVLYYVFRGGFTLNTNFMGYSYSTSIISSSPNVIGIIIGIVLLTVYTSIIIKNSSKFNG